MLARNAWLQLHVAEDAQDVTHVRHVDADMGIAFGIEIGLENALENETDLEAGIERERDAYVGQYPESGVTRIAKKLEAGAMMKPLLEEVTLVVYGWKSVEPGTLAWVFPSLAAAIGAAHAMRNAVNWAILRGRRSGDAVDVVDVERERASGAVLVEQTG